jgi:hypothetical protein
MDAELCRPDWNAEVRLWERASVHRPGDRITVRRDGERITGEYVGLSPAGFLRLQTLGGEAILSGGEVEQW